MTDLKNHQKLYLCFLTSVVMSLPLNFFSTVLPDLPRDAPQSVFDDLPFDNKEMHISELTPLAEIKRMFEILDQMSVRAHVSDDSHGPVAWYEPQQDELLYDDGSKFFKHLKRSFDSKSVRTFKVLNLLNISARSTIFSGDIVVRNKQKCSLQTGSLAQTSNAFPRRAPHSHPGPSRPFQP